MDGRCVICASDEGHFLEVLGEDAGLRAKITACRIQLVTDENVSRQTICHKCSFEVDLCNNFLKSTDGKKPTKRSCFLCGNSNLQNIFDLSKQKYGSPEFLKQCQRILDQEFHLPKHCLVCLNCRYCVELLIDLRTLSEKVHQVQKYITENGSDSSDFPKIETKIVKRKTTKSDSTNFEIDLTSDTDSETNMAQKKKNNKTSKSLSNVGKHMTSVCSECKATIKPSEGTYRLHKSSQKLCKKCSFNTDVTKTISKKNKKFVNNLKNCKVVLKDILNGENTEDHGFKIVKKDNIVKYEVSNNDIPDENKKRRSGSMASRVSNEGSKEEIPQIDLDGESQSCEDEMALTKQKKESPKLSKSKKGTKKPKSEIESKLQSGNDDTKDSELLASTSTRNTRIRKNKISEPLIEEKPSKPVRSRKRKDSEQESFIEEKIRPVRSTRKRKDTEHDSENDEEDESSKPIKSSQRRKNTSQDSESEIEEKPSKPARAVRQKKNSETVEDKPKSVRSRKRKDSEHDSEGSIEEKPVKQVRPSRNKKGVSEQKSKAKSETKTTRVSRKRKESENSVQKVQDSQEISNPELSAHSDEDVINIDDDSDANPEEKPKVRGKKANIKSPKGKKTIVNKRKRTEQTSDTEMVPSKKRGRNNSTESAIKKTRGGRTKSSELNEVIEIDEDSSSEKKNDESVAQMQDEPMEESNEETLQSPSSQSVRKESEKNLQSIRKNIAPTSESEEIDVLKGTDEEIENNTTSKGRSNTSTLEKNENANPVINIDSESTSDDHEHGSIKGDLESAAIPETNITKPEDDQIPLENDANSAMENEAKNQLSDEDSKKSRSRKSKGKNARKSMTNFQRKKMAEKNTINELEDINNSTQFEEEEKLPCKMCTEAFTSKEELQKHEVTHANAPVIKLLRMPLPDSSVEISDNDEPKIIDANGEKLSNINTESDAPTLISENNIEMADENSTEIVVGKNLVKSRKTDLQNESSFTNGEIKDSDENEDSSKTQKEEKRRKSRSSKRVSFAPRQNIDDKVICLEENTDADTETDMENVNKELESANSSDKVENQTATKVVEPMEIDLEPSSEASGESDQNMEMENNDDKVDNGSKEENIESNEEDVSGHTNGISVENPHTNTDSQNDGGSDLNDDLNTHDSNESHNESNKNSLKQNTVISLIETGTDSSEDTETNTIEQPAINPEIRDVSSEEESSEKQHNVDKDQNPTEKVTVEINLNDDSETDKDSNCEEQQIKTTSDSEIEIIPHEIPAKEKNLFSFKLTKEKISKVIEIEQDDSNDDEQKKNVNIDKEVRILEGEVESNGELVINNDDITIDSDKDDNNVKNKNVDNSKPLQIIENESENEALAQKSLEEVLQGQEFQVVDELGESSVAEEDKFSDKEQEKLNCSVISNSENSIEDNQALEIKITDTDCMELSDFDKSSGKELDVSHITEDENVAEEVVQDDSIENQIEQEVEVQIENANCTNGTSNDKINDVDEVANVVLQSSTKNVTGHSDLDPISDEESAPEIGVEEIIV